MTNLHDRMGRVSSLDCSSTLRTEPHTNFAPQKRSMCIPYSVQSFYPANSVIACFFVHSFQKNYPFYSERSHVPEEFQWMRLQTTNTVSLASYLERQRNPRVKTSLTKRIGRQKVDPKLTNEKCRRHSAGPHKLDGDWLEAGESNGHQKQHGRMPKAC